MALFLLIANWMILGGCVMCNQEQLAQDELGMGGGGVAKKRGGLMTFQVYIDRERERRGGSEEEEEAQRDGRT
jgi:hypothetical protein